MAFTVAMLILYTIAPLLYRLSSSAFFNLSLLSSDFYGLLFGLFLYHYRPYWLYFISFVVIIGGLITYFWHSTPEEQGVLNPKPPTYVEARSTARQQQGDTLVEKV
jgi:solute carrier family 35, member F1/2